MAAADLSIVSPLCRALAVVIWDSRILRVARSISSFAMFGCTLSAVRATVFERPFCRHTDPENYSRHPREAEGDLTSSWI